MTITDPLSLLTSRLPQIQTSCGDLSGQITALIAELRIIGKLGLTDARSRLDMDLGNLVDNLSDLCAFKEAGFVNADVAATEEAVVLLMTRPKVSYPHQSTGWKGLVKKGEAHE